MRFTVWLRQGALGMNEPLRDQLRKAYANDVADRDHRQLPEWKIEMRRWVLEQFLEARVEDLLELGAGVGRDAAFFAGHGFQVTCIDLSPEMVHCCRQKGLSASVMDVADLQFADASFDAVYSVNCLLHVPNAELHSVLEEIHRVLRSEGIFYYGTWGGFDQEAIFEDDPLDPPRMFSFRSDDELRRHVEQHFEVLEFESVNRNPEEPKFRFQSLLLRRLSKEGENHGTQGTGCYVQSS